MNFNSELFEKTEAKEFGEFEALALGGHEIVILDAREYESQISGNISLKVSVDIGGKDEQIGFFKKQYDENTAQDKKWPTGGVRYLSLKDEQIAYLKGFITCLEKSNPGFKFDVKGTWDQLKNKKCAGVFGLEEYKDNEGNVKTATKLTQFRSLDKLNDITIPKVKLLNGEFVDYEEYKNKPTKSLLDTIESSEEIIIDDSELPF